MDKVDKISAFMDGELEKPLADALISQLKSDKDMRLRWETYHIISDSLRDHYLQPVDLCEKLRIKLLQEPTVIAPRSLSPQKIKFSAMPIAASVAAVALVGWLAFSNSMPPQEVTLASKQTKPVVTASLPQPIHSKSKSTSKIKEYLLAHQEFSPSTTIQGVAPYVQTVALENDQ